MIAAVVLAGCTNSFTELSDVEVASARLEGATLVGIGVLGAALVGSADLVVVPVDTTEVPEYRLDVDLSGSSTGLVVEVADTLIDGNVELDLPHGTVYGNELLGKYRGTREGITVLGGVTAVNVVNDAGVRIDMTRPTAGAVSVYVATATLWITPTFDADSGDSGTTPSTPIDPIVPTDTASGSYPTVLASGGTWSPSSWSYATYTDTGTAWPTTGGSAWGTTTIGSGSGGPPSDTAAEPTTSPPDVTTPSTTAPSTSPGEETGGSGFGKDSGDCEGCSDASPPRTAVVALLVAIAAVRRRPS